MKVRFQADNDFNRKIIAALLRTEPNVDFQTAVEANLHGLDDLNVLALAALEKRFLVSSDQSTMPDAFAQFILTETSYGVLIVPQSVAFDVAVEELLLIWNCSEAEDWINNISYLPL